MRHRRKILYITGSRSEYDLNFSTLKAIATHPELELQLVVANLHLSSEYGFSVKEIEKDGFKIDAKIANYINSDNAYSRTKAVATELNRLVDIIDKTNP